MKNISLVWMFTRDDGNKFLVIAPPNIVFEDLVERFKEKFGGNELVIKEVVSGVVGIGADFGIVSMNAKCIKGSGVKPTLFCQASEQVEDEK